MSTHKKPLNFQIMEEQYLKVSTMMNKEHPNLDINQLNQTTDQLIINMEHMKQKVTQVNLFPQKMVNHHHNSLLS